MNTSDKLKVVITGAGSGIGKALALRLAPRGYTIGILSRTAAHVEKTAAAVEAVGGRPVALVCDVTEEKQVDTAMARFASQAGGIDVLVNNAGLGIPGAIAETPLENWRLMVEVNATGTFLCSRAALRYMLPAGHGHIINVVSQAGLRTNPVAPLYCASKFAQQGLTSGLYDQVKEKNIKVTSLNPAAVDTPYWGERPVDRSKFLKADEVAAVLDWLIHTPSHVCVTQLVMEAIGR